MTYPDDGNVIWVPSCRTTVHARQKVPAVETSAELGLYATIPLVGSPTMVAVRTTFEDERPLSGRNVKVTPPTAAFVKSKIVVPNISWAVRVRWVSPCLILITDAMLVLETLGYFCCRWLSHGG